MGIALDYTTRIDPAALKAAGVSVCSRYLSWLHYWGGINHATINPKVIQRAEYDELTAASLIVVLNWEYDAKDWLAGRSGAEAHALEAVRQAEALGYPHGAPIVGSADFNMSRAQWDSSGKAYAQAFAQGITAGGYRPGVYGPWDVLAWCADEIPAFSLFWQAGMSTAWSGGRNAKPWPGAHLRQRGYLTVGGVQGDRNDILKEIDMALTDADAAVIWGHVIGGPLHSQPAHYLLSDLADQLLRGKSSYDGGSYGAAAVISAKLDNLLAAVGGGLVLSDAQVTAIAAAIIAHPDTPLGPDSQPAIVAAVKQALREGVANPAAA